MYIPSLVCTPSAPWAEDMLGETACAGKVMLLQLLTEWMLRYYCPSSIRTIA